jgi:hypothetical protein
MALILCMALGTLPLLCGRPDDTAIQRMVFPTVKTDGFRG